MRRQNKKHLAFIRTLPCVICLDNTATEACHIRMEDARIAKPLTGMGIKPDDRFTLPMCGRHHREQHSMNEYKFWLMQAIDPVLTALALYSIFGDAEEAERIINAQHRWDNIMAAG